MRTFDSTLGAIPNRTLTLVGDAAKSAKVDFPVALKVIMVFHSILIDYLLKCFEIQFYVFKNIFFDCNIKSSKFGVKSGDYVHPYYPERVFFLNIEFGKNNYYKVDATAKVRKQVKSALFAGLNNGSKFEITHKIIKYHDFRTFKIGDNSRIGRSWRRHSVATRLLGQKNKMGT
jgi:hypothetical protein